MNQQEHIRQLLDKYLDGLTTVDEEVEMRRYFTNTSNKIPEEWWPYKALFAYIDGQKAETGLQKKHHGTAIIHIIKIGIAVAAVVLALVTITLKAKPENFVIIDGAVYRDKEKVEDEALKALEMVSYDNEDTFGALETLR